MQPCRSADALPFGGGVDPAQQVGIEPHINGYLARVLVGNRRELGRPCPGNKRLGLLIGVSWPCGWLRHFDSHCPPDVYTTQLQRIVIPRPPSGLADAAR